MECFCNMFLGKSLVNNVWEEGFVGLISVHV